MRQHRPRYTWRRFYYCAVLPRTERAARALYFSRVFWRGEDPRDLRPRRLWARVRAGLWHLVTGRVRVLPVRQRGVRVHTVSGIGITARRIELRPVQERERRL